MSFKGDIGFAGVGKMGAILAGGLVESGMAPPGKIKVFDVDADRAAALKGKLGVGMAPALADIVRGCDMLFICIKPDQFQGAASDIGPAWRERKPCFVSIMAGVQTGLIKKSIGGNPPVIRVMPNVAALVRKGAAGIARDETAGDDANRFVFDLFEALGGAVWVAESKLDAVTALSGSGPAYVFMFIEALVDAGVKLGLDRKTANKLAVRTVAGAAAMADQDTMSTLELRAQVTSPGGSTAAATAVLESKSFRGAVIEAVEAAYKRCAELGK